MRSNAGGGLWKPKKQYPHKWMENNREISRLSLRYPRIWNVLNALDKIAWSKAYVITDMKYKDKYEYAIFMTDPVYYEAM